MVDVVVGLVVVVVVSAVLVVVSAVVVVVSVVVVVVVALRKNLCKIINCDKNVRQEWPPNSHSVFYSIHSILHFVKMQCQSARWNGAERNGIGLIGGSSIRRHSFFAIILAKPLS
jgi:hypothetical protein